MSIIRAHMQLILQELEKRSKSKSRAEAKFFCLARGASRLLKYSTLQRYGTFNDSYVTTHKYSPLPRRNPQQHVT